MLIPLGAGFWLAWIFLPASELRIAQSLFVGTALAITAVPVSIGVLIDLDQLGSPAGRVIVTAAIIDDALSPVLLAFLAGLSSSDVVPGWLDLLRPVGSIALRAGLFTRLDPPPPVITDLFSISVIVAIVTTLVSPRRPETGVRRSPESFLNPLGYRVD